MDVLLIAAPDESIGANFDRCGGKIKIEFQPHAHGRNRRGDRVRAR